MKFSPRTNRASRFKSLLVAVEDLPREAEILRPQLQSLRQLFVEGKISSQDYVSLFVLTYVAQRARSPWWSPASPFTTANLPDGFLPYILNHYTFRFLPGAINRILLKWYAEDLPLQLFHSMPTPLEMLTYQSHGQRIVTLAHTEACQGVLVDGQRDALEFVLHDLTHAERFWLEPEMHRAQVRFFQSLRQLYEANLFQPFLHDPIFRYDLDYVLSDMNSHPHHMGLYLRAILIKHLDAIGVTKNYAPYVTVAEKLDLFDNHLVKQ